jgi:site-specific recombinase XerD
MSSSGVTIWKKRVLSGGTIPHCLAPLSSLFEYLCERNPVTYNLVKCVKQPRADNNEGKTPVLGNHQVYKLLTALGRTRSRPSVTKP